MLVDQRRWDGDVNGAAAGTGFGYLELGRPMSDFDIIYAFPWSGEESMMLDLFRCHGHEDARLLLHSHQPGMRIYRRGCVEPSAP